jgi:murein L,D-transpeptidase YcbB/YkuD
MVNIIASGKAVRLMALLLLFSSASSGMSCSGLKADRQDTAGNAIQLQLKKLKSGLHYPLSVERFYRHTDNQLVWIFPDTVKTHGWETMLMLDCVHQFGLNHDDYHPKRLLYPEMHRLISNYDKAPREQKAAFDILLTDALITFMNDLHYGKFNPSYAAAKIDARGFVGFHADTALLNAFQQKDFMTAVLNVQPQSAAYTLLQSHLRLITGQYVGDCYEVPEADVRKIALNMERLRWIDMDDKSYVQINIPSYTLHFLQPDTSYQFKVIVGDPSHPTPALQSAISYFTTAARAPVPSKALLKEKLVDAISSTSYPKNNEMGNLVTAHRQSKGLIIFRFPNAFDIYLGDAVDNGLFRKNKRVYSNGPILVERSEKLAELLLENDNSKAKVNDMLAAVRQHKTKNFNLKNALPVKITYLTCEVIDNMVVMYDDVYHQDKNLEDKLYPGNSR